MARIRTTHTPDTTRVRIDGRLTAADVRRLEHACRVALTKRPLTVQFELGRVTEIDDSAAAFLECMQRGGATVQRVEDDVLTVQCAETE